ncbi:MAG: hypothetical protein LC115_07100 [Bacteroidia bacterium]|nr:hypothetical protein [Bacteroidia bacterium]
MDGSVCAAKHEEQNYAAGVMSLNAALDEVPRKKREDQNLFWDSGVFFLGI